MSTLERRLTKLEDSLLTPPVQAFSLLAEPPTDEDPEAWGEHRQRIEEAGLIIIPAICHANDPTLPSSRI